MEQRTAERHTRKPLVDMVAPLFVPGDRPDRIRKAIDRGARAVIIDLEDAVEGKAKPRARSLAVEALQADWNGVTRLVRVNGLQQMSELTEDLRVLRPAISTVDAFVLPKVESARDVQEFESLLQEAGGTSIGSALIPTIESSAGVFAAQEIAAASSFVHTLLFGVADLSAELGLTPSAEGHELRTARSLVVLACAAAHVAGPWDGPHLNVDDEAGLRVAADSARRLGFASMVAIHPKQLTPVRDAFAPTAAEISWATRVVEAFSTAVTAGSGAVRLDDGTFIDRPIALRADSILDRAQRSQGL